MNAPASCPDLLDFQRLLGDQMDADEQSAIAVHLEACAACRTTLDRLAGESGWLDQAAGALASPSPPPNESPNLNGLLERLKRQFQTERSVAATRPHTSAAADDALRGLETSDNPGLLGTIGPYEISEIIGRGGMGIVFKGFDPRLNRYAAVKILSASMATVPTARRRFLREARAAAAISHDHVVTIHAVDESKGLPYLVMEYVDGISLQELLDRQGSLGTKEILRIGRQIADGLAAAHAQGLIHRDIKPANILLENGVQRVKITDFGLARAVDDVGMTRTGDIAGTPLYMSPEQASGDPADYRTDLFSLGSVLYAMCVGRSPFRADTTMAVLRRVCQDAPRPIREVNPAIPEWLCDIVDQLLEKNPEDRFQSAAEVRDILEDGLAHVQQPSSGQLSHARSSGPQQPGSPWWPLRSGSRPRQHPVGHIKALFAILGLIFLPIAAAIILYANLGEFEADTARPARRLPSPARPESQHVFRVGREKAISLAFSPQADLLAAGDAQGQVITWNPASGKKIANLAQHKGFVYSLDFSPTDRLLAVGSGSAREAEPGTVTLWDPDHGRKIAEFSAGPGGVKCVAFSPDGALLAAATGPATGKVETPGTIHLWDVKSREKVAALKGHTRGVRCVAFSPDGQLLASASFDDTTRLWSIPDGREVDVLKQPIRYVNCVAFSPDGKMLVTTGGRRAVVLWDIKTKTSHRLVDHQRDVWWAAFHPNGRTLATADTQGVVKLWNISAGFGHSSPNRQPMPSKPIDSWKASDMSIEIIRYSPDGTYLAMAANDGRVRLWRTDGSTPSTPKTVDAGKPIDAAKYPDDPPAELTEVRRFEGHTDHVTSLSFGDSPGVLSSGASDGTVRLWDTATGEAILVLGDHSGAAEVVAALRPDGRQIASSDATGTLRLWDRKTGHVTATVDAHQGTVLDVAYSPDGRRVFTAGIDEVARVWDAQSGKPLGEFLGHVGWITGIAVSPDGRLFATSSHDNTVRIWDSETFEQSQRLSHPDLVMEVAFSPEGRKVATAGRNGVVRVFGTESGNLLLKLEDHTDRVRDVAFSPDGRLLASGAWDRTLRVWDAATGRPLAVVRDAYQLFNTLAFSPDGRHIVSGGGIWKPNEEVNKWIPDGDNAIHLWRLSEDLVGTAESDNRPAELTEVRRFGDLHTRRLSDMALVPSSDGRLIATSSHDGTVRFWNVETGREASPPLDDGPAILVSLAFSPDDRTVALGETVPDRDMAARIHIWDTKSGERRKTFEIGHGYVYDLAFSAGGDRFYAGVADYEVDNTGSVQVFDAGTWDKLREFDEIDSGVNWVVPFPRGSRVLVATDGSGKKSGIWDAETGSKLTQFRNLPARPGAVALSPDGATAAIGFAVHERRDGRFENSSFAGIWLCDTESGRLIRKLRGHTGFVNDLEFSADGRLLVSGTGGHHTARGYVHSWDNTLRVWNVETGAELARASVETPMGVWSLVLLPDGRHVVTAGGDSKRADLRLWRLPENAWSSGERLSNVVRITRPEQVYSGHKYNVSAVAFTPNGRRAVSGSNDQTVRLWDVDTGRPLRVFEGHRGIVTAVAISPDGTRILSGSQDGTARLWNLDTGEELLQLDEPEQFVTDVAFSPDGQTALTCSGKWEGWPPPEGIVRLWDLQTGQTIRRFEGSDRNLKITLPSQSGEGIRQYGGAFSAMLCADYSPDGEFVLAGGDDQMVRVWNAKTGEFHTRFLHSRRVYDAQFDPESRHILTGTGATLTDADFDLHSVSPAARLWNIETGQLAQSFPGHKGAIRAVCFSPDGCLVATATGGEHRGQSKFVDSVKKRIHIWDRATGRAVCRITCEQTVMDVAFAPDGRRILSCGHGGEFHLWALPPSLVARDAGT